VSIPKSLSYLPLNVADWPNTAISSLASITKCSAISGFILSMDVPFDSARAIRFEGVGPEAETSLAVPMAKDFVMVDVSFLFSFYLLEKETI